MATINDSDITVGLSGRDLLKASMKMQIEVLKAERYLNLLKKLGAINYEPKLSAEAGTSVTMYNTPRISGLGVTGDADMYTNAISLQSGSRTLSIRKHTLPIKYAMEGTERQQVSEFDLKGRAPKQATQWGKEVLLYQLMNQLGSNTATTLNAPGVYDVAVTATADRLILTGHNAAIAPSATFKGYGSLAAGSISADESVDADNPLTMADIMAARETIMATNIGIPTWNRLQNPVEGTNVDAVLLVSTTGMNQLKNDAVTQGQGFSLPQFVYAQIAGGEKVMMPSNAYIVEGIAIVEMPDNYLPRGVNSSSAAAVANTRRAIMVGANAVDFALGKGYSFGGATIPGFNVDVDEKYKPLNKQGYLMASINGGFKKVQISGTGANVGTSYDNAVYTFTHYSRT